MESRRMVLTNLCAEQHWRHRHGEQTYGQEEEGEINGESSMDAYTLAYVNRWPMGICCVTQGTQMGAL